MYLRGGTIVDGDFFVEGGLKVNNITDINGNTYIHIGDMGKRETNRLVMWGGDTGNVSVLVSSCLESSSDTNSSVLNVYSYKGMIPLLFSSKDKDVISSDPLEGVTYYTEDFEVTDEEKAYYRTLTDMETTYIITNNIGIVPDAWVYA